MGANPEAVSYFMPQNCLEFRWLAPAACVTDFSENLTAMRHHSGHRVRNTVVCMSGFSKSASWTATGTASRSRLVFHLSGLDVDPQFQVLAEFLPSDLEHCISLTEVKSLQRHFLNQPKEIELGKFVE